MQHPITDKTVRFTIDAPFDYLTPGWVYRATPYADGSGIRIDRDDESSGTFLSAFWWNRMQTQANVGFRIV